MTEMREATVRVRTTLAGTICSRNEHSAVGLTLHGALYFRAIPAMIVMLGIIIGGSDLIDMTHLVPEGLSFIFVLPPAWLAYWCVWRWTNRFRTKSLLDPKGSFLSPTQIRLAADGVHWASDRGEGRTNWNAVQKIEETARHVYVFIDRAAAHVVPKRDFANPGEAAAFVGLARSYHSAAQTDNGG